MVMPFSRSRSMESRTWLVIWRASMVWVSSSSRSARRGLAVVDVGDDAEVAQAVLGDGHEAGV